MKSFYQLESFVEPGGAREGLIYILDNIEDVKNSFEELFDLYLIIFYGRYMFLSTYIDGVMVQKINLIQYLEIHIEGYPIISFDENGELQGIKFDSLNFISGYNENPATQVSAEKFFDDTCSDIEYEYRLNWDNMNIKSLNENLLRKDELITVYSEYFKGMQDVYLGINDVENGEFYELC